MRIRHFVWFVLLRYWMGCCPSAGSLLRMHPLKWYRYRRWQVTGDCPTSVTSENGRQRSRKAEARAYFPHPSRPNFWISSKTPLQEERTAGASVPRSRGAVKEKKRWMDAPVGEGRYSSFGHTQSQAITPPLCPPTRLAIQHLCAWRES